MKETIETSHSRQITGNTGLYYVCYKLSEYGWNALPTSRNARGVDIVAYNEDGTRRPTIQVKALSRKYPVPLGKNLDVLIADYIVICADIASGTPTCYIAPMSEIKKPGVIHMGVKNKIKSYWLQPHSYETLPKNKWDLIV